MSKVTQNLSDHSSDNSSSLQPIIIIGVLFFMFGFITWLNGALIPFLQLVCQLGEFQALLIAFSFLYRLCRHGVAYGACAGLVGL